MYGIWIPFLLWSLPIVHTAVSVIQTANGNEKLLAVDSTKDAVALATKADVFIYDHFDSGDSKGTNKALANISLADDVDKYIFFKLFDPHNFAYCNTTTCSFCTIGVSRFCEALPKPNYIQRLSSAAIERSGKMIFSRLVNDARTVAVVLKLEINIEMKWMITGEAKDVDYMREHKTVLAFGHGGFVYFVSSAKQPYEPFINSKQSTAKDVRNMVKITRVCVADVTVDFESRMDLAVSCERGPLDDPAFRVLAVEAASMSADMLHIVVLSTISNEHSMCQFRIEQLEKRFDADWNLCQSVSTYDNHRKCLGRNMTEPFCFIFTRHVEGRGMTTCKHYGLDDTKWNNCELHKRSETSYRYSWLESFIPFYGMLTAKFVGPFNVLRIYPLLPLVNATFLAVEETRHTRIIRILSSMEEKEPTWQSWKLWQTPAIAPSSSAPFTVENNHLLVLNRHQIDRYDISCAGLYTTCNDLESGGFKDPLHCFYCADGENERIISAFDDSCSMTITQLCPPIVKHANVQANDKEIWLFGKNFSRLQSLSITACDQMCNITEVDNTRIGCYLTSGIDGDCTISIQGFLGKDRFMADVTKITFSASQPSSSEAHKSSAWKAIVAVIAIVLLLGGLVLIVYLARRKFMMERKSEVEELDGRSGLHSGPHRNTYVDDIHMDEFYTPNPAYEQLFNDIDDRLKINIKDILIKREIGSGHFGVVYSGILQTRGKEDREIAGKMLREGVTGVREFLHEGLIMDQFKHERVTSLIGIAFTERRQPVIVTDYMKNGDLAKYLKSDATMTLRILLEFAIQIAEGMEYLHSRRFIHRDLAARNCMLDANLNIKISDFGLCRECTKGDQYEPSIAARMLPIRWMAPEAIEFENFSLQGDVWSYGIVLWELTSRKSSPYPFSWTATKLLEQLKAGHRLQMAPYCPQNLYFDIMLPCWNIEPDDRPSFAALVPGVRAVLTSMESNQPTQLYSHYEKVSTIRTPGQESSNGSVGIRQPPLRGIRDVEEDDDETNGSNTILTEKTDRQRY